MQFDEIQSIVETDVLYVWLPFASLFSCQIGCLSRQVYVVSGTGPKYQEDKISDAKYQEQNIMSKISGAKYRE